MTNAFRRCRFAARLLLLGLTFTPLSEAAAPEWVTEASTEQNQESREASDAQILLLSEEVTYLTADRVRVRRRIVTRVVSDGGRQYAVASVLYRPECEKILTAKAWVVRGERRKAETYTHRDFVDHVRRYSEYLWDSQRVLRFSAADRLGAGDVFASEIEVESTSGLFDSSHDFYSELPVARRILNVTPPAGMRLGWHASSDILPAPTPGSTSGSLRWDVRGLPRRIGSEPAEFLTNPLRVSVRPSLDGPASGSWASLAAQLQQVIGPRLEGGVGVREKARLLAAGAETRWARIRAIAEFVQREIYYLSITTDKDYLAGYRPHAPEQVLTNRYGDCKDKAALVVALLREIGEPAWMVLVHSQNPKALVPEWPSASFNHAIVAFPADDAVPAGWPCAETPGLGRLVLFDPTDPVTPLGLLPAVDEGGLGLAVDGATTDVLRLPVTPPGGRALTRTVTGNIDAQGTLHAALTELYSGAAASESFSERWDRSDVQHSKTVEKRIRESLPLADDLKWTDKWDPLAARYDFAVEFNARGVGRVANGSLLFVCPKLLPDPRQLPPWKIPAEGVSWVRGQRVTETVRLKLPDSYVVESLPAGQTRETPNVSCRVSYRTEMREVIFEQHVEIKPGFLDKAGYEALIAALSTVSKQERRLITLRRVSDGEPVDR